MLINLSNHPVKTWEKSQIQAASRYGEIVDLTFPNVDPEAEEDEILMLAEKYEQKVRNLLSAENTGLYAVHIMGELTFCFALIKRLQSIGIPCIASTAQRKVVDNNDGTKYTTFIFVRFREYDSII